MTLHSIFRRTLLPATLVVATLAGAPAASAQHGRTHVDTTVAFNPNGSIELSLVAGAMRVTAWNRNEVRVVANATGDARFDLDLDRSHLGLEQSDHDRGWFSRRWNNNGGTLTYEVSVPAGVRATLSAVSGTIFVAGVHGTLEISGVSGRTDVRDAGNSVSIEGVSGGVTAANIAGDLKVENVSGPIEVRSVGGTLSAETVSGRVVIAGVHGGRVRAETVSGDIDFTGAVVPSGRYDFESHSGRTTLHLAPGASASVDVDTFSGSVSADYPGATRRKAGSDDDEDNTTYHYTVGRGEARVKVSTFSGRVMITQGAQ